MNSTLRRAGMITSGLLSFALLCSPLPAAAESEPQASPEEAQALPLEDLRLFAEVFGRIKNAYVEPVDDSKLLQDAIRGMIAGLDPHSSYLEPKAFESLQEHTSGEFGGLGIEVGMRDGFIRVVSPIDDTPAQRAGIRSGDLITKLDDISTQGMGLNEAVGLMRGKPGEPIVLTIVREGEEKPLEIRLVRDVIRVASVKSRMLDDDYGYLRITQFQVNTGSELNRQIKKLSEKAELKGMVLDLRNNPGGVLQAAVDVGNAFLDDGLIVYTEGRLDNSKQRFSATSETALPDMPLVVLINAGSASASEIVAGALQDHKRAIIMGQDSFGKGSVQTVLPLDAERALKLTTARYFTPEGRSIQAQGIVPDIIVADAELTLKDEPHNGLKEKDLTGHLENGNSPSDDSHQDGQLARKDYQLYEALNLLKALSTVAARQSKTEG